jgi:hypothetical protein
MNMCQDKNAAGPKIISENDNRRDVSFFAVARFDGRSLRHGQMFRKGNSSGKKKSAL